MFLWHRFPFDKMNPQSQIQEKRALLFELIYNSVKSHKIKFEIKNQMQN